MNLKDFNEDEKFPNTPKSKQKFVERIIIKYNTNLKNSKINLLNRLKNLGK
jgi:hypothetical protein